MDTSFKAKFRAKIGKISHLQDSLGWLCFTYRRVASDACIGPVRAIFGLWGGGVCWDFGSPGHKNEYHTLLRMSGTNFCRDVGLWGMSWL